MANYLRQKQLFDQYGTIDPNDYGMGPVPIFTGMEPTTEPYAPQPVMDPRPPSIAAPGVQGPQAPTMDPELKATIDAINQVYTPDTVSRDRLNRLLDTTPERNKPSWARKLVAGGLSLKSEDPIATAEKAMYAPYLRDQAEWTGKTAPFAQAAQLENTANINERTLAGNVVASQIAAKKQAGIDKQNAEKNRITEEENIRRNAINEKKNEIAAAKANGAKFHTEGTKIIATFPDGRVVNTGVDTTNFSPLELAGLNNKARMDEIGARTQGAIDIKLTAPALDPNKTGDNDRPLDVLRVRNNKFLQIADQYPQLAEKWFIPPASPGDNWRIKTAPEPGFWDDHAAEIAEYAKVRQLLGIDPTTPGQQQSTPPPAASPESKTGLGPQNTPQTRSNPRDPNYGRAGRNSITTNTRLDSVLPPDPRRQSTNPNTSRARSGIPEQLDIALGTNPMQKSTQTPPPGVKPGQAVLKNPQTGEEIKVSGNIDQFMKEHPEFQVVYR